jgi:hypothetical protein
MAEFVNAIDNLCHGPQDVPVIDRNLSEKLIKLAGYYPCVTVTGPRQSGKTTLCRATFPGHTYVTLEAPDVRRHARTDPRGFLADLAKGAVIDEVQHVPDLLSYLQGVVDEDPTPGRFVLTGSQHLGLSEAVSQSLAGRTAVLVLLPPSWDEVQRFPSPPADLTTAMFTGAYPRIHDRQIPAEQWLSDYVTTYVERDVRQLLAVTDLTAFTTFLGLAAGRSGQVLNLSALGADAGITHNTARSWLSVMEASFLLFRLPAWHRNVKKQLTRAPKLHFLDSGLLCRLLGIRSPDELRTHPLRGAIFESWVVSEVYKARAHRGLQPDLHYFRDHKGLEVDLVLDQSQVTTLVECKSGATVGADFLASLERLSALLEAAGETRRIDRRLIYGGTAEQRRTDAHVIPWSQVPGVSWATEA